MYHIHITQYAQKEKANLLLDRTRFQQNLERTRGSNNLSILQFALTNFLLAKIIYINQSGELSHRLIEPFAFVSTQEHWLLIAFCRLRNTFRFFRLDRMQDVQVLQERFEPHNMTLQQYFNTFYTADKKDKHP